MAIAGQVWSWYAVSSQLYSAAHTPVPCVEEFEAYHGGTGNQMHELAVGTRFIDHALYSMCMLAMCCYLMSLLRVSHVTSLTAAAFESNLNDVHLMSLLCDEYLAGL